VRPSISEVETRETVWLVRHACAGDKYHWHGSDDDQRPLDQAGQLQASALAHELAPLRPGRLFASPSRRCHDTLAPLAEASGLPIEPLELLAKGHAPAVTALLRLKDSTGSVFCTHGEVMRPVLEDFKARGLDVEGEITDEELLLKGVAWSLRFDDQTHLKLLAPLEIETCPLHAGSS
jgi:phosphohistidine phosphatase SixA